MMKHLSILTAIAASTITIGAEHPTRIQVRANPPPVNWQPKVQPFKRWKGARKGGKK